jgi:hypothetical protein
VRRSLRQVLAIDPGNEAAARALGGLAQNPALAPPATPP